MGKKQKQFPTTSATLQTTVTVHFALATLNQLIQDAHAAKRFCAQSLDAKAKTPNLCKHHTHESKT